MDKMSTSAGGGEAWYEINDLAGLPLKEKLNSQNEDSAGG